MPSGAVRGRGRPPQSLIAVSSEDESIGLNRAQRIYTTAEARGRPEEMSKTEQSCDFPWLFLQPCRIQMTIVFNRLNSNTIKRDVKRHALTFYFTGVVPVPKRACP